MQLRFNDEYLEKIYSNQQVKGKPIFSEQVVLQFKKTVLKIKLAENTIELRQQKGLHFEALKGDKKGLYSVRVNKQYRLEFKIENDIITLVEIILIEHLSKHYET
ncbi:MAG: type II toxin-antitoxin system RelE/ParE family toxin [Segetibacter sp.]|jgi:proteic killer suppression protein|nr:type II toxin-antitoxin system RelE/ParE family toxin [Segetibacter sp.]